MGLEGTVFDRWWSRERYVYIEDIAFVLIANSNVFDVSHRISLILASAAAANCWIVAICCGYCPLDDIRKKAWPKLVGIVHSKQTPTSSLMDSKPQLSTIVPTSLSVISPDSVSSFKNTVMASCIDAVQISLDTARCTWHLLNGTQRANKNTMRNKHKKRVRALLKRKQRRLGNFINLTLIRTYNEHTKLRYYQGYHDVSCIILSVLGGETTVPPLDMDKHPKTVQAMATKTAQAMGLDLPSEVLAKLSHSHFVDLMKDNFEHLTKALRLIVFPLMACLDPEVHQHLIDCDMEPFFCLSWIITWFSHDVRDTAVVKRLFDFFIASHPIMPVYLSIAMVLHPVNRMEVLGSGCDFASLHRTLSQLPMNSSSVGWKFIGSPAGGEYVSGEEEDDDSCSFDGSIVSQDVYREEGGGGGCGDDDSLAPSLTSESMLSGCCDSSRVPFQEVMDMAIKFM
jgi:TBC domain.